MRISLKAYTICAVLAFLILSAILVPSMRVVLWFICIGAGGVASMMFLLLPILIAKRRRHRNYVPIVILTFLCWPVALVWAFTDNVEPLQGDSA